ncbi:MAG: hypothetical protein U0941_26785 [Planctomycetaceae bacterium]
MNDTLYHLCFEYGDSELELISSHATREEACEEREAQCLTMTKQGYFRVMCIAELELYLRCSTNQQDGIRKRISTKRKQLRECQRERALLRRLLGELPEEAYMALTAKFIELTDLMEEIERYIKNGFRRIERCNWVSDHYRQDLALLRAALCAATAANKELIDIMEQRSLLYTSSIRGDETLGEKQDSE